MLLPPTTLGELPRFFELDPIRFQGLCRDLYQAEPEFATVEVFGTPGQSQYGVDIVAYRRDGNGVCVGQSKCIRPDSLTPSLIRDASKEFLKNLAYWRKKGVQKFVLFVAPDTSRTEIQEESFRQRKRFKKIKIDYELWGEAAIANKLRPRPGITRTYLHAHWEETLCGTAVSGFPQQSVVVSSILSTQIETLASYVSDAAENEVEVLRSAWRRGKRTEAVTGIARLRDPSRWQVFSPSLKAKILRFEAQLALEANEIPRAKKLAAKAGYLDPSANIRLLALIARADGHPDRALELIEKTEDIESLILRAGLLMEGGRISEALSLLDQAAGHVEAPRLRALGFVLKKDLARARLEAQQAYELAPAWHATLLTRVIVNYFSGLSPAVLPQGIPQWPEPEDWRFIKTDDESRVFFRSAADAIEQIEREAAANPDDRRVYEAWHLACLANDPERRDEATFYCRDILTRDPANYRVLAWALARRLDVDLAEPVRVLKDRVANSQASAPEVIALLVWFLRAGEAGSAKKLLENARPLFVKSGDNEVWRFWMIQIAAAAGEVPAPSDEEGREAEGIEAILVSLRAKARTSGNWEPLIAELRTRSDKGDGRAAFEICSVLASLNRWNDAVPVVRILVEMVGTAEALSLACGTLYKAKHYDECLRLLDANRKIFPRSELPNEMQRLRVAAQSKLGLLPAAMAAAEDLFRREPSKENFLALADLNFEKGDFAALAVLARRQEQFEGLSNTDLLRLSIRVINEDKSIATEIWRRASSNGFVDEEVPFALTLGYKLGLDRELRSLVQRLSAVAERSEGHVRRMDLDQVREFLLTRQNDVVRVYRMYRAGDIPVHLVAQHMNRPLVFWYHRAFIINEASGRSEVGPTLVRHGWRTGMSVKIDPEVPIRLHADLTALLIASHFDVLSKIEAILKPIFLPRRTVIALASMRDEVTPVQPARREALRNVNELVSRGSIRVVDVSPIAESITQVPGIDVQTARILLEARSQGWLFADFLPLNVPNDPPSRPMPNDYESILRTPHCIVEELGQLGEISGEQRTTALVALGPEHGHPVNRDIKRDADILCSASVLELLASCGVLKEAARSFNLRLRREEFDMFVVNELANFQTADEDAMWLAGIIDRINRGIESGVYQFLPDLELPIPNVDTADVVPAFKCLLDLTRFASALGDVIWADDRWITGFAHREGVPIIDTYDLCHILRERKAISDNELHKLSHRLRNCDARYYSLDVNEIKECVCNAELIDYQLIETRELRTLRRYYANSLAQGDMLCVTPKDQRVSLEWPFLHASSSAVVNAIIELWKTGESREVVCPRADWVLTNLYVPDRGRAFTSIERSGDVDYRLESVSLASFMSLAIALANPNDPARRIRKDYFEWIYGRLIRRRFEADPILASKTLDVFKTTLDKSIGDLPAEKKHRYIAVLISQLLDDMPDELSKKLVADREFIGRLRAAPYPVIRFGQYQIKADKLWNAGAEAFLSKSAVSIIVDGRKLTVKILEESGRAQLLVEDSEARMRYVILAEGLGILSDSIAEREAALRSIADFFDLPKALCNEAIARISSLNNAAARVSEMINLRLASAQNFYFELGRGIRDRQPLEESDFLPEDVESILRHLRLGTGSSLREPLSARLERAAAVLIEEVGLKEAIIRFAGLPIPLATTISDGVDALSPEARRLLLKRLIRVIGKSPLGTAHLARMFARYGADHPSYMRYFRASMRKLVMNAEGSRYTAWLEVLRYCADAFSYIEEFRRLPVEIQICITWAHSDRLFRILLNIGVDEEWIRDSFNRLSTRHLAEIVFSDNAFTKDVANPRRISALGFMLACVSYASEDGILLDDILKMDISKFMESDRSRLFVIIRDLSLTSDALGSILRRDGHASWLSVFTPALQNEISPTELRPQLVMAIESIRSGQADFAEWVFVRGILIDDPVPGELTASLCDALLATNLAVLHEKNPDAAIIAAMVSAQLAGRLGKEVLDHVRGQLIILAKIISKLIEEHPEDNERAREALISAAFYLYSTIDLEGTGRRFEEIARLLEELTYYWPAFLEKSYSFIGRLVEVLPNKDSRWLWKLQIKLRALR